MPEEQLKMVQTQISGVELGDQEDKISGWYNEEFKRTSHKCGDTDWSNNADLKLYVCYECMSNIEKRKALQQTFESLLNS